MHTVGQAEVTQHDRTATEAVQRYAVEVVGLSGAVLDVRGDVRIEPAQSRWVPVAVRVPPQVAAAMGPGTHTVSLRVARVGDATDGQAPAVVEKSTFMVPR